jgi:hypothetical protein
MQVSFPRVLSKSLKKSLLASSNIDSNFEVYDYAISSMISITDLTGGFSDIFYCLAISKLSSGSVCSLIDGRARGLAIISLGLGK